MPLLLLLTSAFALASPIVEANYRLGSVASDTWPGGSAWTYTQVIDVKVADAGGTTAKEVITAGIFHNGTWPPPPQAQLRIYHMDGGSLVLDGNYLWSRPGQTTYLTAVDVVDIDGNGQVDTVFVGNSQGSPYASHIGIYSWTGSSLVKQRLHNFTGPSYSIETRSMAIWTNVGIRQIVTLGYYNTGGPQWKDYAQLGIWSWDGSSPNLTKNALYNWTTTGTSSAGAQGFGVATGDVDGDGVPEIVTVGFSKYNDTSTLSQLKIWGWTGTGLPLLKFTREWTNTNQASVAHSLTIRDLDGDGDAEIIVSGQDTDNPFTKAELTVWGVDSTGNLNRLAATNWVSSNPQSTTEFARVATGDVDGDGHLDVVTAGHIYVPSLGVDYGILRVWAWEGTAISLKKVSVYDYTSRLFSVAIADVQADGKQDIVVGGFKSSIGLKGLVEVRNVALVYGSLTLTVTSTPALSGQSVTVSGTLTNETDGVPFNSAPVLMEYSKDGGAYQILATVTSDSQGRFATSFTPGGPGSYMVRATWNGNEDHMGSVASAALSVNKVPSAIVLSASSFTAKPGETLTVSGYLYPASPETITVTYTSPSGTSTSHTVTSDNTGAFSDQYTVDTSGTWQVSASWTGDTNTAGSSSNTLQVETQPEPLGLTLSPYDMIAALAALGLAAFALVRKPKAAPQPRLVQPIPASQPAKVETLSKPATSDQPEPAKVETLSKPEPSASAQPETLANADTIAPEEPKK